VIPGTALFLAVRSHGDECWSMTTNAEAVVFGDGV
jgi:hypothetical protein